MDGLPLPQTPTQLLVAIFLAMVSGSGIGASLTAAVALYKVYQERGKAQEEIHLSGTQRELNLAQAAKAKADADSALMGVALAMATASHEELVRKRAEVKEKEQELDKCREQVRILEKQQKK